MVLSKINENSIIQPILKLGGLLIFNAVLLQIVLFFSSSEFRLRVQ